MAKCRFTDTILRGSVGGMVFSTGRGGPYVRQRISAPDGQSPAQLAQRATLITVSRQWKALTSAQRLEWDLYADTLSPTDKLLNSISYSGHQVYCQLSSRLLGAGVAAVATPPAVAAPASLTAWTSTITAVNTLTLGFTPTPMAAGVKLQVWQSKPYLGAIHPLVSQAKLVGYTAAAVASGTTLPMPYSVLTGYKSYVWARVMGVDGQVSGYRGIECTAP